jgi:hypothetical protein
MGGDVESAASPARYPRPGRQSIQPREKRTEDAMSLQGRTDEEIQTLEAQLLERLRSLGSDAGNTTLRRALDWSDEIYWPVRDRLVDRGILERRRARGGAIRIVTPKESMPAPESSTPPGIDAGSPSPSEQESDLYGPVAAVLRGDWARDYRFEQSLVEITAAQGRRRTGGTWTRPDVVVAALRLFQFLPGKYFDLVSFEVKPRWAIDVTAVYEALAHRRAATQAYVWFHCPADELDRNRTLLERIAEEAERHGVGMFVATDPAKYETWDIRVEAQRVEPDPVDLNDFLKLQLSEGAKDVLSAWVR